MNNKRNLRKRLIILAVTLVILAGAGVGAGLYIRYRNDQKTVNVLPMSNVSTTYWGDQTSCSGNIVSDYVQELYPDSSKTISEVFVQEGQEVKVGDPLLQYDRTTLELDVEAKEIAVKQAEVKVDEALRQLKKYQNTKPSSSGGTTTVKPKPTKKPTPTPKPTPKPTPTPTPGPDVPVYSELTEDSKPYKGSGTSDDPFVFLCKDGFTMSPGFIRLLWGLDVEPSPTPIPTPDPEETPSPGPDDTPTPEPVETPTPEPGDTSPEPDEPTPEPTSEPEPEPSPDPEPVSTWRQGGASGLLSLTGGRIRQLNLFTAQDDPTPSPSPSPTPDPFGDDFELPSPFAAVFEVREFNNSKGKLLSSVKMDGTKLSAQFHMDEVLNGVRAVDAVAGAAEVHNSLMTAKATPSPDNYNNMGYTSAELSQLIKEKKREITGLNLDLRQAKLDLDKAKQALENSTVVSTIDGQVRSLIDIESALAESKPFLVVTGAQQYYVSGSLSETLLGSVNIGDEVSITAYGMNGMSSYTAQIVSISDYPDENSYYYGSGNPNSSNYQFSSVILDPDEEIQTGSYVEIGMNVAGKIDEDGDTLYLYSPYLREDDGGYYVLKADQNNRLMKQYIQVGKTIWGGEYYEIKSGLTLDDFVAFPYGTDAKEGVRVLVENTEEPPFPEEGSEGADSSGLESTAGEDSSLSDGESLSGDEGIAGLPEGGVITDQDENGTYYETEDGGGVILD